MNNQNFNPSWWLLRLSPILFLPSIFFESEIAFLTIGSMLTHFRFGLESIFNDYNHDHLTQIVYVFCTRLLLLQIFTYFVEFLF